MYTFKNEHLTCRGLRTNWTSGYNHSVLPFVYSHVVLCCVTAEYAAFLRAVLSATEIPKSLSIALTDSPKTIPRSNQPRARKPLQVWVVRDGEWGEVAIQNVSDPEALRSELAGYIHRLSFPATVSACTFTVHALYMYSVCTCTVHV